MPRTIAWHLYFDWDFNGAYTDESAYLVEATGDMRVSAPGASVVSGKGIAAQMNVTMRNPSQRFSSLHIDGALHSYLQGGGAYHVPCYLEVSIDGGSNYSRVFTGVAKVPVESTLTSKENPTVTIDCRGREEAILNKRLSTEQSIFSSYHDGDNTESQYIARWLVDAGLTNDDPGDFVSQYVAETDGHTATLDPGSFVIPFGWLDDESAIEDCWSLASAAAGRFYCDPEGIFRYENAQHWLQSPHQTSQETLSPDDFQNLEVRYDDNNIYKVVNVEANPRQTGVPGVLWEPDDMIIIPANASKTVVARLRQPAYAIDAPTYNAVSAGGKDLDSDVSVVTTYYAQTVSMAFTNANATYACVLRKLRITGTPVEGGASAEEEKTSAASFWTNRYGRTRSVRGNVYIQSRAQAEALAQLLVDWHDTPTVTYRFSNVLGKPSRRLGDRITVNDTNIIKGALTNDRYAFITSLAWRLSNAGFTHTAIEAIDTSTVYTHEGNYFMINDSTLGSTDRMFY